jgi:hypothetical protein
MSADPVEGQGSTGIAPNVPLPGQQRGRRFVRLKAAAGREDFLPAAAEIGEDIAQAIRLRQQGGGSFSFDPVAAAELYRRKLRETGATPAELAAIDEAITTLRVGTAEGTVTSARDARQAILQVSAVQVQARVVALRATGGYGSPPGEPAGRPPAPRPVPGPLPAPAPPPWPAPSGGPVSPPLIPELRDLFAALETGVFLLPRKNWTGTVELVPVRPADQPDPTLFLIEEYAVSSTPGSYGLGRTLRTMSLFPGESVEITVQTWRTTREQVTNSSSILDSFSTEAADRFNTELHTEQSDTVLDDTLDKFSWDAHASGGIDFGFFSLGGGGGASGSGEHHSSRQQFSKHVSDSLAEHTRKTNDARQLSVSSTAERVAETGVEETTVRTIRNVNMRRTLNFVFRELNQEFRTRLHLVDLRVGFDNGRVDSWREASLAGLRPFLQNLVAADRVDAVVQVILGLAGVTFNADDEPVPVLETLRFDANGQHYTVEQAALSDGAYPPPADGFVYRFRRGALGQSGSDTVPGVVLSDETTVLRTDSLVAEALLGQVDALDAYALEKQDADASAALLDNQRHEILDDALRQITDPEQRAAAYAAVYRPQVVRGPIAVVGPDGAGNPPGGGG